MTHETAKSIATGNFDAALDSVGAYGDGGLSDSIAAHFVNAVDTAREYGVSADKVARIYMRSVLKHLGVKKNPLERPSRVDKKTWERYLKAIGRMESGADPTQAELHTIMLVHRLGIPGYSPAKKKPAQKKSAKKRKLRLPR